MIYSICFVDLIQIFGIMRADQHTITRDIKWPVKHGQNTARLKHVGQNASKKFSVPKIKSLTKLDT